MRGISGTTGTGDGLIGAGFFGCFVHTVVTNFFVSITVVCDGMIKGMFSGAVPR